jgi:hypothetical protein
VILLQVPEDRAGDLFIFLITISSHLTGDSNTPRVLRSTILRRVPEGGLTIFAHWATWTFLHATADGITMSLHHDVASSLRHKQENPCLTKRKKM